MALKYRSYAESVAKHFRQDMLARMGLVLENHTSSLVEFVCEMQERLDAAEALLAQVANCQREWVVGSRSFNVFASADTLAQIDALVNSAKARSK